MIRILPKCYWAWHLNTNYDLWDEVMCWRGQGCPDIILGIGGEVSQGSQGEKAWSSLSLTPPPPTFIALLLSLGRGVYFL